MSRWIKIFACAILSLGLTASRTRADLVVNLSDVTMAPGGTGTMDITVSSTTATTLSFFNLELLITPVTLPSDPTFLPAMNQPTAEFGSMNYVFAGQSFSADNGVPFWSDFPGGTNYNGDTITGGDLADSGAGYASLAANTTYLLAQVDFSTPVGATGTFQVSLVPTTYDPPPYDPITNPQPLTQFQDSTPSDLLYTSNGGLVTVTAVPEPTSLVMGAIASLGGLLYHLRRRRIA